jgi:hypothetical protein
MEWIGMAQDRKVTDTCECVNEPSGSRKCRKFLNYLRTYQLLNNDFAPWG